jgi:hypothetical protein
MTPEQLTAAVARLEYAYQSIANRPLLHRKDLLMRYGVSEDTLDRWRARGLLPEPIRFTGPLWRLADLEAAERAGRVSRPLSA